MVNASTQYYRANRISKKVLHSCPHCDYETTNTRIQMTNHINAKHVEEKNRPYQCVMCVRGFAQKAHLETHLFVTHEIEKTTVKISSISYIIEPTLTHPRSIKTKARRAYYLTHRVINTKDINNKQHEYLPGVYLKKHDIHYDTGKGFITLTKCPLSNTLGCRCNSLPKRIVCV